MNGPQQPTDDAVTATLVDLSARMLAIKERRDALDSEYSALRDALIKLSGAGRRVLPNGIPIVVQTRATFDPRKAFARLDSDTVAKILAPAKIDPKLAKLYLSETDYQSCLSDVVTHNVRIG